jgi:outer membrane protein/adhesin transport system outer membrane protein
MMIGAHKQSAKSWTASGAAPRWGAVGLLSTTAMAAVVLLGTTGPGAAQSLVDAMAMAYTENPTLQAARAALRAVDDTVPEAKSFFLPSLTASGSVGKNVSVTQARNGIGTTNTETTPRGASVNLSQPVFRGFRTVAGIERAKNDVLAQRARLLSTEQTVLLDTVRAYADVWQSQAIVGLRVKDEQVLTRQLEAARDRFEVGEVTRTDVSQAQARVASSTSGRIAAEGDLNQSRATYLRVVGTVPGRLEQPPILIQVPATLEEAIAMAQEQDPDVVASVYAERSAQQSIRQSIGELLPEVTLNGSYSKTKENGSPVQDTDSFSATVNVSIPLYEAGGANHARVRQARQTAGQRRIEISEARRAASEAVTVFWEDLVTARSQIEAFSVAVEANRLALDGVEQEASVGARTVLDILDAEEEYLNSQVNLVSAQRDEVVASYAIATAIGRLTARDVDLPVEVYDEEEYYNRVKSKFIGLGEYPDDLVGPPPPPEQ